MPIYEYKCNTCGHAFEYLARSFSDAATVCPKCGAQNPLKQLSTFHAAVPSGDSSRSVRADPVSTCSTGRCSLG